MMITYTVYYKRTNRLFWRKLKKVKGDNYVEGGPFSCGPNGIAIGSPLKDIRVFFLEDETRIEIDMHGMEIRFSKERYASIQSRMSAEAGRNVETCPR